MMRNVLLVAVLGLFAASACGGIAILDDDASGGASTTSSGVTTSGTGQSSTTKTATTVAASTVVGAHTTPVQCNDVLSTEFVDLPRNGPCSGIGSEAQRICFAKMPFPTCEAIASHCVLDAFECGLASEGIAYCPADAGPLDACCFTVVGGCPIE